MTPKNVHMLVVDLDTQTAGSLLATFQQQWPQCSISIVTDGAAALNALRSSVQPGGLPRPHLILLNLGVEHPLEGLAFLNELRQDPVLRRRPVFVLGHSNEAEDILAVYDFIVAGYVLKTRLDENHQRLIDLLEVYLNAVEFCDE